MKAIYMSIKQKLTNLRVLIIYLLIPVVKKVCLKDFKFNEIKEIW